LAPRPRLAEPHAVTLGLSNLPQPKQLAMEAIMIELKSMQEMTIGERRDILTAVADTLQESSREASLDGHRIYAETSRNFAATLRSAMNDLTTDKTEAASILLQQAMMMIFVFRQRHLYPAGAFLH
jgi:hypothetical protein